MLISMIDVYCLIRINKALENKKGCDINYECHDSPWFKGALFALAANPDTFFPALHRASSARDRAFPDAITELIVRSQL